MLIEQELINEMDHALENHEFVVYYQPIVDVRTKKTISAEALVRWLHPKKGMISPGIFIPAFEKNGFITKLDIMLDSGAFSAYTKGESVNLAEYMAYIKKYEKYFTCYVNLDVIGDAEASARNQAIMEANGLHPMPVFHIGEEFVHLKKLMDKLSLIDLQMFQIYL